MPYASNHVTHRLNNAIVPYRPFVAWAGQHPQMEAYRTGHAASWYKIIASISRFLLLCDSDTAVFYHRVIPLTAHWSPKKPLHDVRAWHISALHAIILVMMHGKTAMMYSCYIVSGQRCERQVTSLTVLYCFVWIQTTMFCVICLGPCINYIVRCRGVGHWIFTIVCCLASFRRPKGHHRADHKT